MESTTTFRPATIEDLSSIWDIISFAIEARKKDGSNQWQDGYPNKQIIHKDITNRHAYVLTQGKEILFYAALIYGKEPAYEALQTGWLTQQTPYAVIHRLASSPKAAGQGLSKIMMDNLENKAQKDKNLSVRIDTNHDNSAMLHILEKRGYRYCGKVYFRGSERYAFEKFIAHIE